MNNTINTELKPTMVRITKADWEKHHKVDDGQIAGLCLRACGGGYTEEQTAEAMELNRKVHAGLEGETFPIFGGYYFVIVGVEPTVKRYEVLHTMVLGEPENIWQEGTEPLTFASKAEAQAEIDEHIKDIKEAVARGDMTESDETDLETYIISEVKV